MKHSISPALTPPKRIKEEEGSPCVPMSRVGPIAIDDNSDIEMEDSPLLSLENEVLELDNLIKEARRRHEVQHGKREAVGKTMARKHLLEEEAEQEEMDHLNGLRAKSVSKLNSHLRKSIVGSRMLPSRVVASVTVPIKREVFDMRQDQNYKGSSGPSAASSPDSSVPTSTNTRATSLSSPLDGSRAISAPDKKISRPSKKVKKEDIEEDYHFVYNQDSDGNDSMDINRINSLMDPAHTIWNMADSAEKDMDMRHMREMEESEVSEGSDNEVVDDNDRRRTASIGHIGRKRKLTQRELATVSQIQMPDYILSLNNDYYTKLPLPETSVKFSREFLTKFLGGNVQETYVNISHKRLQEEQVYPITRYYCFCPLYNPQVPPSAGRHGAGLSIGTPDTKPDDSICELQHCVSYFVKRRSTEWEYCGEYVQGRRYEKLRPDEMETHVPEKTKRHWAEKICSREWGVKLLLRCGAARDERHAKTFTMEQVRRLFDRADNAPGVKLRFYWQYMECCDYNLDLYEALSRKGLKIGWTTRSDLTKENNFGVNAAMPTAVLEDWDRESPGDTEE